MNASQAISVTSTVSDISRGSLSTRPNTGGPLTTIDATAVQAITSTGNNSISVAYTNGSQAVTKTVPPTIVCNYLMRII